VDALLVLGVLLTVQNLQFSDLTILLFY